MFLTKAGGVTDWLVDNLTAAPDLGGVQISEAWVQPDRESIVIGDATMEQEWQSLGARTRSEDVTVDIWITVIRPGDTAADARTRCEELAGFVATVLRTTPGTIALGGLCTHTSLVAVSRKYFGTDEGVNCQIHAELTAHNIRF
jgi:hypothetical protein